MAQLMPVNDFIRLREKDWKQLQNLVEQRRGLAPLGASEVRELGKLYRAVTSDLALARRDYPNQPVTVFLNQLLTRTHTYIYRPDVLDFKQLTRYFTHTLPHTFRQTWLFTLIAFLLFIVPALVGYRLAFANPAIAEPLGLTLHRQTLADKETWTDIPLEQRPYASAFIMSNNIRVSILAFGGGIAFGLFTVYVLAMNGLIVGTILGLAGHYEMGQTLLGFMFPHGVIELSVIFIASGSGLQLGWALLNPGPYTRRDALGLAARRAVTLVLAAIPLLIIAGVIEGFLSPSDAPFGARVAVGLVTGIILYAYLFLAGRHRRDNH